MCSSIISKDKHELVAKCDTWDQRGHEFSWKAPLRESVTGMNTFFELGISRERRDAIPRFIGLHVMNYTSWTCKVQKLKH